MIGAIAHPTSFIGEPPKSGSIVNGVLLFIDPTLPAKTFNACFDQADFDARVAKIKIAFN